ncbi:hypothetical protein Vadar_015645 [Vaccinium darrowii]|uniref:Uncharacterized protein n=1 Tax=Vaccinium darrowii TaxID=229202 RepID=A0ACB7Y0Y0_9ERIC|nr:hypothetical protein Vadar_015645 [Vaccinium darrowii]
MWFEPELEFAVSKAEGFSGGLITLWNSKVFNAVEIVLKRRYILIKGVISGSFPMSCIVVNIYTPNEVTDRRSLWEELLVTKSRDCDPCFSNTIMATKEQGIHIFFIIVSCIPIVLSFNALRKTVRFFIDDPDCTHSHVHWDLVLGSFLFSLSLIGMLSIAGRPTWALPTKAFQGKLKARTIPISHRDLTFHNLFRGDGLRRTLAELSRSGTELGLLADTKGLLVAALPKKVRVRKAFLHKCLELSHGHRRASVHALFGIVTAIPMVFVLE